MALNTLTPALEDYLETIYLLLQEQHEVRVREISKARNVKASSVSLALKRLSELGLIRYVQRELIEVTDEGRCAARRVYARHVVLFQFFHDILGMDEAAAREEACGLEHALSDEGMDRFVRFFETISMCPTRDVHCLISQQVQRSVGEHACTNCANCTNHACHKSACAAEKHKHLNQVNDGESVTVLKVVAAGELRQKLLETGILPNVVITKKSVCGEAVHISIDGNPIALTFEEAEAILVKCS